MFTISLACAMLNIPKSMEEFASKSCRMNITWSQLSIRICQTPCYTPILAVFAQIFRVSIGCDFGNHANLSMGFAVIARAQLPVTHRAQLIGGWFAHHMRAGVPLL
jgi:hypothetical protein